MPVEFEVTSYWSNIEPGEDGWWWVYMLGHMPPVFDPTYVGIAGNLRRRLAEHARLWPSPWGYAYVIGVETEDAARSLERSLIAMLQPPGNTNGSRSSTWIERRYFATLATRWQANSLRVCERCGCLYEGDGDEARAVTDPGKLCGGPHDRAASDATRGMLSDLLDSVDFLKGPLLLDGVQAEGVPEPESEGDKPHELAYEPIVDGP